MTLVLIAIILVLCLVAYVLAHSSKAAHQRALKAESALQAARVEILARERDNNALQIQLQNIRSGSPDTRFTASLDSLQDAAARTGGGASGGLAGSSPPARDGN